MQIRTIRKGIRMQIRRIWKKFVAFECKFEIFEKGFEAFECKLESFERDSKLSNLNSNHSKGIRTIPMHIRRDSKYSKEIHSIRMQIRTIRKGFEALKCTFEQF